MPCGMRPVGQVLQATIPMVLGDADHKLGVQSALETSALARDHAACLQVNRARVTPCGHRPSVVRVGSGWGAERERLTRTYRSITRWLNNLKWPARLRQGRRASSLLVPGLGKQTGQLYD